MSQRDPWTRSGNLRRVTGQTVEPIKIQEMKMSKNMTTRCPDCESTFDIHENRNHKIREGCFPIVFYDAMNQFENFNQVQCPKCKKDFKAPEARLFGIFKSPYTVVGVCIALNVLMLIYFYLTVFRKK